MEIINPINWLRWTTEFVRSWLLGVPWRDAPKAIPAIILTIILFTTGFIAFSDGSAWRMTLLQRQLGVSLERDDFDTAEIVMRRQLEADPENTDLMFNFASIRATQSHEDEATAIMRQLVNRRHVSAAMWLLNQEYIGKRWEELDEAGRAEFGAILELIHDNQPENTTVKKMLAEFMILDKRFRPAIDLLDELSEQEPMRGLQAAALARQLGDLDAAERYAEKTLGRVSDMSKDDPTNSSLALAVARNQVFLQRYSDAIRTLDRSVKLVQSPQEKQMLSQALGDAIVSWVTFIEESPSTTINEKLRVLKMLQAALRYAPNNPRVVTMIADQVLASLDEEDDELESVRQALIEGSSVGIAHFIKGTSALMKEDYDQASLHLELATELMPRSAAILNNLAVALAMREPPDYERALMVSNAAIDQVRDPTPHFFETRGQILFRMERFKDAIPDLERALAVETMAQKAHEMLADCYAEVGDEELAKSHRQAAEENE